MRIFMQMGNTLATLIMAPIIGAWADYGGRKKPLITILSGLEVYVISQTLGVYFYTKINVFYFFLTAEIFSGLCGGLASLSTLALSIVSDDARADYAYVSRTNISKFKNFLRNFLKQINLFITSKK